MALLHGNTPVAQIDVIRRKAVALHAIPEEPERLKVPEFNAPVGQFAVAYQLARIISFVCDSMCTQHP